MTKESGFSFGIFRHLLEYCPMKRSFDIFYEDQEILVVIKPSGLLTIGTEKDPNHNLYHYVREYLNAKRQKVFIVHRLDKDTSGLLIFAKSIPMKEKLQKCFEEQSVKRSYEAIIKEHIDIDEPIKVVQYLAFDEKSGNTYATHDRSIGKKAVTWIEKDHENKIGTVLSIHIETGRRNQIRLALKSLGYTLLGDRKYSEDKSKRMFLNAYELVFPKELRLRKSAFSLSPLWLSKKKNS